MLFKVCTFLGECCTVFPLHSHCHHHLTSSLRIFVIFLIDFAFVKSYATILFLLYQPSVCVCVCVCSFIRTSVLLYISLLLASLLFNIVYSSQTFHLQSAWMKSTRHRRWLFCQFTHNCHPIYKRKYFRKHQMA